MKYFIKSLRHYADFSGRACRKEFWMFALFNFIFSMAWTFLVALIAVKGDSNTSSLTFIITLSWLAIMVLPSMAVSVRRLHDVGKSGWLLLVALIPLIGGIWLLILMLTDGHAGENKYGRQPKKTAKVFTEHAKLNSVGIALIFSIVISLPLNFQFITRMDIFHTIFNITADVLLLTAGILLLNKGDREKVRPSLIVLLVASGVIFIGGMANLLKISDIIQYIGWQGIINAIFYPLNYLFMALFVVALLFSSKNRNLIRITAMTIIVFSGIVLLWRVHEVGKIINLNDFFGILNMFAFMMPVVKILLAWTFISKVEQPVMDTSFETIPQYEADEKIVYQPSSLSAATESKQNGGSGKGLGWKIFGLIVSIGLIAGGLSGDLVLRGTNSSEALVVFGVVLLIVDIIALATHNKGNKKKKEYEQQLAEGVISSEPLSAPATIRVVRDSSIVGAIVPYKVFLNYDFIGNIKNGKCLEIATHVSHNIITVTDNADNPFKGEFVVDLNAGDYAEVHVKAGRFVKK